MHTRISFLLICGFVSINFLFSQGKATFTPERPKIGDVIKIKYDPKGSPLENEQSISADIKFFYEDRSMYSDEIELTKEENVWSGQFRLDSSNFRYMLLQFISDNKIDNNNDDAWDMIIYGKNGKPLRSAMDNQGLSYFFGGTSEIKKKKNREKTIKCFTEELKNYPDNYLCKTSLWNYILLNKNTGEDTLKLIRSEIDEVCKKADNEKTIQNIIDIYKELGDSSTADKILESEIIKNPKGSIARNELEFKAFKEKDMSKRIEIFEKILLYYDPPESYKSYTFYINLVPFYARKKNWDRLEELLTLSKTKDGSIYANVVQEMLRDSSQLDRSMELNKKAMALLSNPDKNLKYPYWSEKKWLKNHINISLYGTKNYFAQYYEKRKKYDSALMIYRSLYEASNKQRDGFSRNNGDIQNFKKLSVKEEKEKGYNAAQMAACYCKLSQYDKALDYSKEALASGCSWSFLIDTYKTAYTKVNSSENGCDSLLQELKNIGRQKEKNEIIEKMIYKKAPAFELKSLDGKTIKLSDLRGKVVFLDFWSTTCSPCIASFPFLQKVYDKYKDNTDVCFYTINTWENGEPSSKEKRMKDFMEKKKNTFPVLLDINSSVADIYGVRSIPIWMIVDKEGIIRIEHSGFVGYETTDETEMQMEILINNEYKKEH